MKNIKNLIFDFDGVILDSVEIKNKAFLKTLKPFNKNIKKKFMKFHLNNLGVSRFKKFEYLCKDLLKQKKYEKLKKKLINQFSRYTKEGINKAPFIEGIKIFLAKYKYLNLFISSGTPQTELRRNCKEKKIKHLFSEILGSPMTKIEHIDLLKKKYNVNKANSIFFGDSSTDYYAAKISKIDFVQVGSSLKKKNIKFKINNFNDKKMIKIIKLLKKN